MKKLAMIIYVLMVSVMPAGSLHADQTLKAVRTPVKPVIDGIGSDRAWSGAEEIITHDKVADIDIKIKAVYTDKEIFFIVSFTDPDESKTHKSWVWDKGRELYKTGKDREDIFVFKWNMGSIPVDLSIYAENFYKADVWLWKALRTDPVGYADDKIHILSPEYTKDAVKLTGKAGTIMYLLRKGDSGTTAYKTKLQIEYEGDAFQRFINQTPTDSRADVKAKGVWMDGKWVIEFGRALNTGNDDDVRFDLKKGYQFGVSRYEIAGRKANRKLTQPLYGSGDVSEELVLVFE